MGDKNVRDELLIEMLANQNYKDNQNQKDPES
jgi:hypothetical protein